MPVNRQGQGSAEAQIPHETAPGLVIDIQIWIKRQLAARTGPPQPHFIVVTLFARFEKRIVVKAKITRLEIALSGTRLGRNDLAVGNGQDNPIDIRKLISLFVYPVIIWVSFEYETVGRRLRF